MKSLICVALIFLGAGMVVGDELRTLEYAKLATTAEPLPTGAVCEVPKSINFWR